MTSERHDDDGSPRGKGVVFTLRKKHLETASGTEFKALLFRIAEDGRVSADECKELHEWLSAHYSSDIPAVRFLLDEIEKISADSRQTEAELRYLLTCVLRVLPKADRDKITPKESEPAWKSDPATKAQQAYILALGGEMPEGATKGEASALIDSLLAEGGTTIVPATNRQRMLLRFWRKEKLAEQGKWAVSEWIDEWNEADPDREVAWALWKNENDDDGEQNNPEIVPIGIGFDYLKVVKSVSSESLSDESEQEESEPGESEQEVTPQMGSIQEEPRQSGCMTCAFIIGFVLAALFLLGSCLKIGR